MWNNRDLCSIVGRKERKNMRVAGTTDADVGMAVHQIVFD